MADLPITNKQHTVPQNFMDVEFKLVGDLTMRQFVYLLVFGGIAYVISITVFGIFRWPLVAVFCLVGLGLAFIPIQERGLDQWLVSFFKSVYKPSERYWRKEPTIPSVFLYENIAVVKQEMITLAPTTSRRKLEEYLEYQGKISQEDPLDIPEKEFVLKVRQAYAGEPQAEAGPAPSVGVGVLEPFFAPPPQFQPPQVPEQPEEVTPPVVEEKPQEEVEEEKVEEIIQPPAEEAVKEFVPPSPPPPKEAYKPPIAKKYEGKPKPVEEVKPVPPKREAPAKTVQLPKRITTSAPSTVYTPITPDMHVGRRFFNLLPSSGELVLPIRGEKVLKTTEELEVEGDINVKAEKLQQLLEQIKGSEDYKKTMKTQAQQPQPPPQPQPERQEEDREVDKEAEDLVKKLQGENERLNIDIQRLRSEIQQERSPDKQKQQLLQTLEEERRGSELKYETLRKQVQELKTKLKERQQTTSPFGEGGAAPSYARIQPLTYKPNIITGVVKNNLGNVLEGVLLIVKTQKGEPVRALKTNKLGQFLLSTPLTNGLYTVEVTSNISGQTFDIISVEVSGEIIPPMEIVGK